MIIDSLDNLSHYRLLHPNLDKATDYLMETELQSLTFGRNDIDGQRLFLNYGENVLAENLENKFEYHKDYADIHIVIEGAEKLSYGFESQEMLTAYDNKDDFGLDSCQSLVDITLKPGYFIIFFPEERHRPGGLADAGNKMKKQVVKVLMDENI